MTDRDVPEPLISSQAANTLHDAITELRSQDGMLLSERTLSVNDVVGVQDVVVGATERGQYVAVTSTPALGGPFMRDLYMFHGDRPTLYRINIELEGDDAAIVEKLEQRILAWQCLQTGFDESERAEQATRFKRDIQSFSEKLNEFKAIGDLHDLGDITAEEAERRRGEITLSYDVYQSDDPDEIEYEAAYAACAQAVIDYQAMVIGISRSLEIISCDITEGTNDDVAALKVPLTEARAWNLILVLDRVTAQAA